MHAKKKDPTVVDRKLMGRAIENSSFHLKGGGTRRTNAAGKKICPPELCVLFQSLKRTNLRLGKRNPPKNATSILAEGKKVRYGRPGRKSGQRQKEEKD